jgi:membrane-bound ClpP family serine protease
MNARLILAIFSTLVQEVALVVIVLWGLPRLEIYIPLAGIIILGLLWAAFSIFTYRIGSRALRKKPVVGLPTMIDSRGEVVIQLAPEGLIKIKGELWVAASAEGKIDTGVKVIVVGQEGLKLVVRMIRDGDLKRG